MAIFRLVAGYVLYYIDPCRLCAQVLSKVAKEIYPGDVIVWERWRDTLGDFSELNRLHWSEQLQQYADVGINAPEVALGSFAID